MWYGALQQKGSQMKRTIMLAGAVAGSAAALALPGCIFVDGSSSNSAYRGYGSTSSVQFNSIVASNTQSRIGEHVDVVLARFPAEHVTLVRSSVLPSGEAVSVYRVYAREKYRSTRFERYYVFQNDVLSLLTDDESEIERISMYSGDHD